MKNHRHGRREFLGLTGAGLVGVAAGQGQAAAAALQAAPETTGADLVVFNAKVYTMDPAAPRAEAFAVKAGRFAAVGSTVGHQGAHRQEHADDRREADDDRAGVHRHATITPAARRCCTRCSSAIRSRSSSSPSPASSRSCARRRGRRPPGTWVEGYFHDDTKLKDKRPLNVARPRPGVDRASGRRAASRRPHVVLQQQGVRAGRCHEGHAESRRAARSIAMRTAS